MWSSIFRMEAYKVIKGGAGQRSYTPTRCGQDGKFCVPQKAAVPRSRDIVPPQVRNHR